MAKFKLQTVLDYRERLESLAQQAHAEALDRETRLLGELTAKRRELDSLREEFEGLQRKGLDAFEFSLYSNHIGHAMGRVAELVERWEAARDEVETRRQALCVAGQERQLLEKLKEKHLSEAYAEELHKEAVQLDEVAVRNFRK
ncbi:MAG: flagellar export protein FliJ [Trichloromonas sp.]|jgi:flagellar FliJ protein|nr:flagellar export protein FliJ [Trichloromonas sp.]